MTHSFDEDYWDQIWTGERAVAMSTAEPNPHLIKEIGGLEPGTAIDAGCGAGAEAVWLATQGWTVTAADIAAPALAVAEERAVAAAVGGQVEWVQADLSIWEPNTRFDLVTTHYAHPAMPQLEFYDRIASWVAAHGTLLIVGHLHHHGTGDQPHEHERPHPPAEASATATAITARLDPATWELVTAEESQRTMAGPDGRPTTIADVVVRATRRP
ncbi:methyltransferase domain-containing protein [Nakamurella sp.]|uniref:methyltransferase domain-containing protein n=1 Tax=Nakamurella sp. TaxID=1869182 RepID=UPI003784E5A0